MKKTAHITIAGQPFCDWTGTQAGRAIQDKVVAANSGLTLDRVCCGHATVTSARRIAQALRPHFKAGKVAVVVGRCPELSLVEPTETVADLEAYLGDVHDDSEINAVLDARARYEDLTGRAYVQ